MLHEIAPYRYHIEFTNEDPKPEDLLCLFQNGQILARDSEELILPAVSEKETIFSGIPEALPSSAVLTI